MENSNRNDVYSFFKEMSREMQLEIIEKEKRKMRKVSLSRVLLMFYNLSYKLQKLEKERK